MADSLWGLVLENIALGQGRAPPKNGVRFSLIVAAPSRSVSAIRAKGKHDLADSGSGTLRDAILTADAGKASDKFMISFAVTGTVDLQSPLPDVNNSITIQGPGASGKRRRADASLAACG